MVSPVELVQTISAATGVPLPTVVDIDRRLVKGNLRTKGGRGFNAARMSPLDAARLLTAVVASSQANMSVEAVERYAWTQINGEETTASRFAGKGLDDLAALPATHGFVDMLVALIASAATGSLAKMTTRGAKDAMPRIEIYAFTRATRGMVRLSGLPSKTTATAEYTLKPSGKARKSAPASEGVGDLEQSRRITERTVFALAELFAEEVRHD